MTEQGNTQYTAGRQGSPGTHLGAELIDVLIRNLELAKANLEGGEGGQLASADGTTFCTLFYAEPGHWCPLLYYHSLTEPETEPAV